jgi:hypothetical protein
MAWRVANSLLKLREQVNELYPDRKKTDDGTIGDERHQSSQSDHNPDPQGVVRAMDLTHDPAHGFNSYKFADLLRAKRDPRIKYVISNRRIWSSTVAPYQWRPYTGSNPHDRHVHVSVVRDKRADDVKPWNIAPAAAPPVEVAKQSRFDVVLKRLLEHEGGNDDDRRDPGGRTSRGITQGEYNIWRRSHPGLPADVWQAPQAAVRDIYKTNYWDAIGADKLPVGVDYAVFDYGVNSGIRRASKSLQEVVGANPDGYIGPFTLEAVKKMKPDDIVTGIAEERLGYLRHLPHWSVFGGGWTTRVADVRKDALSDIG